MQMPTSAPPPMAPGFSIVQQIIPTGYCRGCLEVHWCHGDGDNDDSVRLGTFVQIQSQVRSLPTMGHLFIPVVTLWDVCKRGTLGFAPQQMEISYMRVYDYDASNILQKFDWNPEGRSMYLTQEWSDFCVVFRGNVENLDVDASSYCKVMLGSAWPKTWLEGSWFRNLNAILVCT
jgi:hypothetical protein